MIDFVPSTNRSDDQIRQLFKKHVPEVASGLIQVMSTAYEPGYLMVAVHSRARKTDPVRVFVADEGLRVKLVAASEGEILQAISAKSPIYEIVSQAGPEHQKLFIAKVLWEGLEL